MKKQLALALVLAALISACAAQAPTPVETPPAPVAPTVIVTRTAAPAPSATPTPTPTLSPTKTATPTLAPLDVGPDNFPAGVNPLTGLAAADPALLERKPLAVKVQLFPRFGRPPWGINSADIVYEYYQNGGITRLHALFNGTDAELVGPIRSARMLDHELILMYKSIFAYGSADARVNERLFSAAYAPYLVLEGGLSNCPPTAKAPMCRFDPSGTSLLLTGTQALTQAIQGRKLENTRQNLDGMRFTTEPPADGAQAGVISIRYSADSYNRWEYDPETNRYTRFQDTALDTGGGEKPEVLVDRTTDEPIAFDNVVVIIAPHSFSFKTDTSEIVEVALRGFGKAYLFRDGQVYEVSWGRATDGAVLSLFYPDGSRAPFKPGNTWFQVIGQSSKVSQPEDGLYRFEFAIP